MDSIKAFYSKFKEIWNNKRYHALIILLLYFIFFAIVLSSISPSSNQSIISKTSLEKYEIMNEYKYEVKITQNEDETYITGYKSEFEHKLTINDEYYKIINNLYYDSSDNLVDFKNIYGIDINDFEPKDIVQYINKGTLDSETKYTSGLVKKSYIIPTMDFLSIYASDIEEINPILDNIIIDTYEDDSINKIQMDLSSYMNLKNVNKFIIEINYNVSKEE